MYSRLSVRGVCVGVLRGDLGIWEFRDLVDRDWWIGTGDLSRKRIYRSFAYREAVFRICCERFDEVTAEIVLQRQTLEDYIRRHPEFGSSLEPLAVHVYRGAAQTAD